MWKSMPLEVVAEWRDKFHGMITGKRAARFREDLAKRKCVV
jgi:hypothetical protein